MTTSSESPIPFIILGNFSGEPSLSGQITGLFADKGLKVLINPGETDGQKIIDEQKFGMILFYIKTKAEIVLLSGYLLKNAALIRTSAIRVIGALGIKSGELEKILKKQGVTEFLDLPISGKTFLHKLDRHKKIILASQGRGEPDQKVSRSRSNENGNGNEGNVFALGPVVEWIPPLMTESDCWFVLSKNKIRRSMGKWLIDFAGPPPKFGSWEPAPTTRVKTSEKAWYFKSRLNDDPFQPEPGSWYFHGNRPEFSWETCLWKMIGKDPRFYFLPSQGELDFKVQLEKNKLYICQNRSDSDEILARIRQLLTEEKVFSQDPKRNGKTLDQIFGKEKAGKVLAGMKADPSVCSGAELGIQIPLGTEDGEYTSFEKEAEGPGIKDGRGDTEESGIAWKNGITTESAESDGDKDWEALLKDLGLKLFLVKPGDPPKEVKFLDLFDTELTFTGCDSDFEEGQTIGLLLSLSNRKPALNVTLIGSVLGIEIDASLQQSVLVNLMLNDIQRQSLSVFMKVFEERQYIAVEFINKAQGHS